MWDVLTRVFIWSGSPESLAASQSEVKYALVATDAAAQNEEEGEDRSAGSSGNSRNREPASMFDDDP